MRSMQFNLEFGYQLSICSKDREELRKTLTKLAGLTVKLVFKNLVRTSKKTQPDCITTVSWLVLFKEITVLYLSIIRNP
jgi:hypothetical protein